MTRLKTILAAAALWFGAVASVAGAQAANPRNLPPAEYMELASSLLEQLIEIDTTDTERGDNTRAARVVADVLLEAGFPPEDVHVLVPEGFPTKGNLVARLRGSDPAAEPILLLAHLDVVEALAEDWSPDIPPFEFQERDGYFYGRGTADDKDECAIHAVNLIRLRREGFVPRRDIVIALTADEESGTRNGVEFLLADHRDLIDAAFALNEGGGGMERDGRKVSNNVQGSEKVFLSFWFRARNPGGHSSLPVRENALPQLAEANVNCRLLPGHDPDEVEEMLRRLASAFGVEVERRREATPSPPSPMTGDVLDAIERVTEEMWPGVPVLPVMTTGATDGLYLRNAGIPVYGVSGIFGDMDDVRAHGRDERIRMDHFHEGQEFLYRLVKALSAAD
ncbi:MAG: M20/M25/M40 family metallo-hydrolase [Acidobacteria bacterium]|nr:M20/M25/M40 family metallo-hydrolase [Acidobacteriota bacterium]